MYCTVFPKSDQHFTLSLKQNQTQNRQTPNQRKVSNFTELWKGFDSVSNGHAAIWPVKLFTLALVPGTGKRLGVQYGKIAANILKIEFLNSNLVSSSGFKVL